MSRAFGIRRARGISRHLADQHDTDRLAGAARGTGRATCTMTCPNCGELNEQGARFCFNCGEPLTSSLPPEPPAAPAPTTPPPAFDPDRPIWPPPGGIARAEPVERAEPRRPDPPPIPRSAPVDPEPRETLPPPTFAPPPPLVQPAESPIPPQYPDWRMGSGSTTPTEEIRPPKRRRNRFLLIVLGILLGCLLICIGLFVFSVTPAGEDFFEDFGTSVADMATERAEDS